jgi:hypothetical protein
MSKKVTIQELLKNRLEYEGKEITVTGKAKNIDFFFGPPWIIFRLDDPTGKIYIHGPEHLAILELKPPSIISKDLSPEEPKAKLWTSNKELEKLLQAHEVMVKGLYKSQNRTLPGIGNPPTIVASQIAIYTNKRWLNVWVYPTKK